jgi:hypothetical protein
MIELVLEGRLKLELLFGMVFNRAYGTGFTTAGRYPPVELAGLLSLVPPGQLHASLSTG